MVVYVTSLNFGPNLLIKIATIRGPPANPSFTGCGIPGNIIGMLPNSTPSAIPIKIEIRLGSLSLFKEFPKNFSTLAMLSSEPTTVTLSPNCSCNPGSAIRSTPARLTRVIFTPKLFLSLRLPNDRPFICDLVIDILLEISIESSLFQSSRFISIRIPKSASIKLILF